MADAIPPLDERRFEEERATKRRELELREREVATKETELRRSRWLNPITLGLFVATLGLAGNAFVTYLTNTNSQSIERMRAQSNLALDAIKTGTGNTDAACKNLLFLVKLGLLDDPNSTIRQQCDKAPAGPPSLPAATTSSSFFNTFAGGRITGIVNDPFTRQGIPGVSVWSAANKQSQTVTDANGEFVLNDVPSGTIINFYKEGYGSATAFALGPYLSITMFARPGAR